MDAVQPMVTATKLKWIAEKSERNPREVFNNVMHLFNEEGLRSCYHELDGKKAVGTDGINKEEYGKKLEANLKELSERIRRMGYRPGAVRQVLIPKEDKTGTRPLGISNFEDKIVQKMVQKILESIYEPLFKECSHGFRVKRGCHTAIKGLHQYLYRNQDVETVIDVDIKNFFGSINHKMLEMMLREKISDERFIRYIIRMFKAGVLADGEFSVSDEGVPQGSVCSPTLANIFAHHVIDEWFQEVVKKHCRGRVEIIRYADDMVIACQYQSEAEKIKEALEKRLAKYGLKLNQEKTKLVEFSRKKEAEGQKQGSFDFLGFTWYLGRSQKGRVIVKVKTSGKRLRAKLKKVSAWVKSVRNMTDAKVIWKTCSAKLRGHIQYYGISYNYRSIGKFRYRVIEAMFKWLNRRSQRRSYSWDEFKRLKQVCQLPNARIVLELF